jgi:hypothetical protein
MWVSETESKMPVRRPRHRWEDNVNNIRHGEAKWIILAHDRHQLQVYKITFIFHKMDKITGSFFYNLRTSQI